VRARARVRIVGRFNGASSATVTIVGGLFSVRPFRRRRAYELPLADVAERVIFDVVRAEVALHEGYFVALVSGGSSWQWRELQDADPESASV
jgi:hypothetical protein